MKLDSLVRMRKYHPVDMIGSDYHGSFKETVGSVVIWGAGIYGAMWLARWYTLRTLKAKGLVP